MSQSVKQNMTSSFDSIKAAHDLSGDSEKLQQYYDKWSIDYDRDVFDEEYVAPQFLVDFVEKFNCEKNGAFHPQNVHIVDAGCGTGLVGMVLKQRGYRRVDGFDLSEKMIAQARATGAYKSLSSGIDLTKNNELYLNDSYDVTICCGVFTLGHVPPTALLELARMTRPGGLIFISTRKSYYKKRNFQKVCDRFQQEGRLELLDCIMDGPYIAEEGAHYWAFTKSIMP